LILLTVVNCELRNGVFSGAMRFISNIMKIRLLLGMEREEDWLRESDTVSLPFFLK
jgi:hypothetical protein